MFVRAKVRSTARFLYALNIRSIINKLRQQDDGAMLLMKLFSQMI
ncbi:MAG: hypothetical protein ACKE51_02120 [Methylococcaceae bacterium]